MSRLILLLWLRRLHNIWLAWASCPLSIFLLQLGLTGLDDLVGRWSYTVVLYSLLLLLFPFFLLWLRLRDVGCEVKLEWRLTKWELPFPVTIGVLVGINLLSHNAIAHRKSSLLNANASSLAWFPSFLVRSQVLEEGLKLNIINATIELLSNSPFWLNLSVLLC